MSGFGLSACLAAVRAGRPPGLLIAEAKERIAALDPALAAFERLAPAASLAAAAAQSGPLAGIAIGVKDIFDTADMATGYGSALYDGHRPAADAALVAIARARGAAIIGKTVTTEFAFLEPARTRHPLDARLTPGGSSSGSAAAVAAGLVPAAFGSQTGGSTIRPASFCGIAGYKPSFRLMPTVGMKVFSWSLDTPGLFAASVADVALLATLLTDRPLAVDATAALPLRVGVYRSGIDARLDPAMAAAIDTAARALEADGAAVVDIAEPAALAAGREAHQTLQLYEAALALAHERLVHRAALSPRLRTALDEGAGTAPAVYDGARRLARQARRAATGLFETVDVLLAPSALGPAPARATTGDPSANKLWTLTGNPVVSVPGLRNPAGLPLGVSIIARFGRDPLALQAAARLEQILAFRGASTGPGDSALTG